VCDNVSDVKYSSGRFSGTLPLHRDTWASNDMTQLSWWAPLMPLPVSEDGGVATVRLHPSFFRRSVPNTSKEWDFDELRACRRRGEAYPQLPVCSVEDGSRLAAEIEADAAPVVVEPADLVCFSSAHLHASAPNSAGVPRFSTEVRTVCPADVALGLGAPNVDGAAPRTPGGWFRDIPTSS